ncbi:MAG: response regulator [Candidatus Latescibacterota bacterium]
MSGENGNRTLRLVVIDSDRRARSYVKQSFAERNVRVIGEASDIKGGLRLIRGLQPDVLLVELPENASETMEAIRKIRSEQPGIGIIISKHDPSPHLILSGIRAGAQEFVGRPVDAPELEKAVDRVRKLLAKTVTSNKNHGSVISVFSGKGGIGATSIAANLAVALSQHSQASALLVDLSFQMGDLGLMLDQPPRYSLVDALIDGRLDESKLHSVISQHSSGVNLLTVAASPEIGEEVTRHHIVELFGLLNTIYDFVIVDIGRQLDDRIVEVLDLSDAIIMLATLEVPAIRNTKRYLEIFERLELDRDKIRLIVNRFQKKSQLSIKDLEAALGLEVFWRIPNDFAQMRMGIDGGNPVVMRTSRSKVARSFKELADLLCEESEEPLQAPPIQSQNTVKIRSNRLTKEEMVAVKPPNDETGAVPAWLRDIDASAF